MKLLLLAGLLHAFPVGDLQTVEGPRFTRAVYNGVRPDPRHARVAVRLNPGTDNPCTGVLIRPNVVLTAAHCIKAEDGSESLAPDVGFFDDTGAPAGSAKTSGAYYHRFFRHQGLPDDIAVIRLAVPQDRGTAALPEEGWRPRIPQKMIVVGAGKDEKQNFGTLKAGLMSTLMIAPRKWVLSGEAGAGLCGGDSGGPAFLENELTVIAVHSSGHDLDGRGTCHNRATSTVTAVAPYVPWIESAINALEYLEDGQIAARS